ncbi:MAG: DNA gyrase inhibitor YacG [Pseudomonadales bacterium]|nr:DNA gyrase inhibitor YacG [Pseudomonadales bacterium]
MAWIDSNKYRPFCSKRCQLIDFGEWATEKHSIAGEPVFPPEEDQDGGLQ